MLSGVSQTKYSLFFSAFLRVLSALCVVFFLNPVNPVILSKKLFFVFFVPSCSY